MKKEEFVALGIDEKLSEKAAKESEKELAGYVSKDKFDEVSEAKKLLETSAGEYKTQLETIKASAGDNEALKKQIMELQKENKQKDLDHQAKMKDVQLSNAIKLAVAGKAHDGDLITGLIDKSKLILGDDGSVTGLEEQVKSLKENKAFLFKEEATAKPTAKPIPGFRVGVIPPNPGGSAESKVSMKDAIAAKLQNIVKE